jgi:uncharacterized protein YuzE
MNIDVDIDRSADAAYIRLSASPICQTRCVNDSVNVDLDELGLVVGVEMLQLAAEIPFSALVTDFHVHSEVVETLRLLRPSIQGFVMLQAAGDGSSYSRVSEALAV